MQIQFYQTYREEIPEHSLIHGWSHWSLVIRKHPLYLSLLRPFWPIFGLQSGLFTIFKTTSKKMTIKTKRFKFELDFSSPPNSKIRQNTASESQYRVFTQPLTKKMIDRLSSPSIAGFEKNWAWETGGGKIQWERGSASSLQE